MPIGTLTTLNSLDVIECALDGLTLCPWDLLCLMFTNVYYTKWSLRINDQLNPDKNRVLDVLVYTQ